MIRHLLTQNQNGQRPLGEFSKPMHTLGHCKTAMQILLAMTICLMCCPVVAQRGEGPTRVVVGNVIETNRAAAQSFVGTLQATRITTVGSAVDGRVTAVKIAPGDPVTADLKSSSGSSDDESAGQILVEIRSESLKIEMQGAELQHRQMQQALKELELSLPQDMELAAANQQRDKSQMAYTKSNFQRLRKLQEKSGAISTIELEEARSQFLAAEQAYIGSRATSRRLSSTRELQLEQARSRVDSAFQETLRMKDMLDQYTVRAPFGGVVTQKLTEVGQWVTRGQALCEIVQLDPIEMIVNIPQEFTGRLQESMEKASESDSKLAIADLELSLNVAQSLANQCRLVLRQGIAIEPLQVRSY